MPLVPRDILKAASRTGFAAAALEQVERLAQILDAIQRDTMLASSLVLKGGTALHLFFDDPSRLSVDLDFNYVASVERETMLADRPRIERELEEIAREQGYLVQRSRDAFAGRKLYLAYRRSSDGYKDRIEIDLNYLHRQPLVPPISRAMWRIDGRSRLEARLLEFDELAAGKLTALLDRGAARDLWDVAQLPRIADRPWPSRRSRTIVLAYAGTLPLRLDQYGKSRLTRVDDSEIASRLQPLLRDVEEPDTSKLATRAWSVLEPFLDLDAEETAFFAALEAGRVEGHRIARDDAALARRIDRHPPLLWKATNAAKRRNETT